MALKAPQGDLSEAERETLGTGLRRGQVATVRPGGTIRCAWPMVSSHAGASRVWWPRARSPSAIESSKRDSRWTAPAAGVDAPPRRGQRLAGLDAVEQVREELDVDLDLGVAAHAPEDERRAGRRGSPSRGRACASVACRARTRWSCASSSENDAPRLFRLIPHSGTWTPEPKARKFDWIRLTSSPSASAAQRYAVPPRCRRPTPGSTARFGSRRARRASIHSSSRSWAAGTGMCAGSVTCASRSASASFTASISRCSRARLRPRATSSRRGCAAPRAR